MLERDIQDHIVTPEEMYQLYLIPDVMHQLYLILKTSRKKEAEAVDGSTITMNSKFLIRSLNTGICKQIT